MLKISGFIIRCLRLRDRRIYWFFWCMPAAVLWGQQPAASPQKPVRKMRPEVIAARQKQEQQEAKKKKKEYRYPVFSGLTVGADLFQPLAMAFGQTYGSYEVSVQAGFHHRFFPIAELGVGRAKNTPEDMNFTYVGKPAFYGRVGLDYNFKYNSSNPNVFYVGFRYGTSSFKYDITDITIESPYWDQVSHVDITGQRSYAHWIEGVAGLRVQLYKNFSMGWSIRYKWKIRVKKNFNSSPWYIPGFGTENMPFGVTYSVYYRIPVQTKKINPLPNMLDAK